MGTVTLELDEDLVALLEGLHQPVREGARELIVLELYRRGVLSSGRAAELLGLTRYAFIQHASQLGIPYFRLSEAELQEEIRQSELL